MKELTEPVAKHIFGKFQFVFGDIEIVLQIGKERTDDILRIRNQNGMRLPISNIRS